MKKGTKYAIWIFANVLWWLIDIGSAKWLRKDLLPTMSDGGEVIFSLVIFAIGMFVIWSTLDDRDQLVNHEHQI